MEAIHPEPKMNIFVMLLPIMTTALYFGLIIFSIYFGIKALIFIKNKERRDEQIIEKLNSIEDKLNKR